MFALDGHTYDRSAITKHLAKSHTSPITKQVLPSKLLIPNHTLQYQITQTLAQHPRILSSMKPRSFLCVGNEWNVSYFTFLTLDVIGEICLYLDLRSLCRFGRTCKEHVQVSKFDRIWKQLMKKYDWHATTSSDLKVSVQHSYDNM